MALALKAAGRRPVDGRARLEVVLVCPRRYRVDADNVYARCKPLVDAAKAYLVDDSTEWLDPVVRAEVATGRKATKLSLGVT